MMRTSTGSTRRQGSHATESEMIIHTTCFNRLKEAINPVSISRTCPKGIRITTYTPLAPSWDILNAYKSGRLDWNGYVERYHKEVLEKLDRAQVLYDLYDLSGSTEVTLVCWEKSGSFCHRHLVYS